MPQALPRPETLTIEDISVEKRDGSLVRFEIKRISAAVDKAFRAELGVETNIELDVFTRKEIIEISNSVADQILASRRRGMMVSLEEIQDLVEVTLMQFGYYGIAKRYIIYRQERAQLRASRAES